MTGSTTVDVAELVERSRVTGVRLVAVVLCALVALFDGFDLQIIGLAAPSIAAIRRSVSVSATSSGAAVSSVSPVYLAIVFATET